MRSVGHVEMRLGLDAFRDDERTGLLAVGGYGVDDRGDLRRGLLLDEIRIELDDVRSQQRQQREGAHVGTTSSRAIPAPVDRSSPTRRSSSAGRAVSRRRPAAAPAEEVRAPADAQENRWPKP